MSDLVRELNAAIDDPTKGVGELRWHCAQAADRIEALEAENADLQKRRIVYSPDAKAMSDRCEALSVENEAQARLNGMGAERELALMARLERLERAALAVIAQWDTPNWKLTEPTAKFIENLRSACTMQGRSNLDQTPSAALALAPTARRSFYDTSDCEACGVPYGYAHKLDCAALKAKFDAMDADEQEAVLNANPELRSHLRARAALKD